MQKVSIEIDRSSDEKESNMPATLPRLSNEPHLQAGQEIRDFMERALNTLRAEVVANPQWNQTDVNGFFEGAVYDYVANCCDPAWLDD